jgi:hypothetical protein
MLLQALGAMLNPRLHHLIFQNEIQFGTHLFSRAAAINKIKSSQFQRERGAEITTQGSGLLSFSPIIRTK